MLSDGAIYSSIDFMGKAGYSSPAQGSQPTPYATTQILQSNSFHELAVDRPDPRWKASLQAQQEMANLGYSLTDRRPGNGNNGQNNKKSICSALFISIRTTETKGCFVRKVIFLENANMSSEIKAGRAKKKMRIYLHIYLK